MPLCDICSSIDVRAMLVQALDKASHISKNDQTPAGEIEPLKLHSTINILDERKNVCDFCALLWKVCIEFDKEGRRFGSSTHIFLRISRSWAFTFLKAYTVINDPFPLELLFTDPEAWTQSVSFEIHKSGAEHNLETVSNDPIRESFRTELSPNSGGDQALEVAHHWYQRCLNDHSSCRRASETKFALPTRLIEVGDDARCPHLYITSRDESSPTHGAWVSLSYCWGGGSELTLTKDTISSLMAGIPLKEFPKTLHDAILITRTLGVKYLWIDALCILQDSLQDWEQESPKMSQIYSNAVLTIIAAIAPTVNAGIFQDRKSRDICHLPWYQPNPTDVIWSLPQPVSTIGVRKTPPHLERDDGYPPTKWATRGWVLQECLLSWRTLQYLPSQMVWSCTDCVTLENGKIFTKADLEFLPVGSIADHQRFQSKRIKLAKIRSEQPRAAPAANMSEMYKLWYNIVEDYSNRSLTNESDRLPGIGGLAKSIVEDMQDTYHAGLWENDFICGLTWKVRHLLSSSEKPPLFSNNGLLTWNWTSPGIPIRYFFDEDGNYRNMETARVKSIQIDYSSSVYGAVNDGRLVFSGPCCSVRRVGRDWEPTTIPPDRMPMFHLFLTREIRADFEMSTKIPVDTGIDGREFVLMQLLDVHPGSRDDGIERAFMLLECLDASLLHVNEKLYRRAGMLILDPGLESQYPAYIREEMEDNPWPERTLTVV